MAQAWVLIFFVGASHAFTVSNVYSEASCNDLGKRIQQEWMYGNRPSFKCFPYDPRR